MKLSPRTVALAIGQGLLGGAVSAVTLGLMHSLQHHLWHLAGSSRWSIPIVIMLGGLLLALLQRWGSEQNVTQQVTEASHPVQLHRRRTAFLALSAIVAVSFGGAVGPEAGLIAVMTEISALVTVRLARSHAEQRLIGETGTSGALDALYGAPSGSSMFDEDVDQALKFAKIIAGAFGFLSFLFIHQLFDAPGAALGLSSTSFSTSDIAASTVAGVLGAGIAAGYLAIRSGAQTLAARVTNTPVRILCGSAVFATVATLVPQVRFSGHEDISQILRLASEQAWWTLLGIAILKLCVTAINLATGWLGGDFFPLVASGSAVGVLTCGFLDLPPETAAIAGMTAAATVGMRKPLPVLLIIVLVSGGVAVPAAVVGMVVGLAISAFLPPPASTH